MLQDISYNFPMPYAQSPKALKTEVFLPKWLTQTTEEVSRILRAGPTAYISRHRPGKAEVPRITETFRIGFDAADLFTAVLTIQTPLSRGI